LWPLPAARCSLPKQMGRTIEWSAPLQQVQQKGSHIFLSWTTGGCHPGRAPAMLNLAETEDFIESAQPHYRINESAYRCRLPTEDGGDQIELKKTDQPPVQTPDKQQNGDDRV
jgi:hypothetical protein